MNRFLRLNFEPRFTDLGLLVFRVFFGVSLFIEHGLYKFPLLFEVDPQFPDPLLIGVRLTIAFALLSDGICSVLAILGLATRFAALIMAINMTVGWGAVYQFRIEPANGELLALFLGGAIALGLIGPGRFSLDSKLGH